MLAAAGVASYGSAPQYLAPVCMGMWFGSGEEDVITTVIQDIYTPVSGESETLLGSLAVTAWVRH
ncbi:hypothetical protein E2C01_077288 [Portunus trituberculatus]|uniref:Uncharacterized protein n=1 Tax=Portunus trituberculatus TaxID=210409 RepID=A0A5B7IJY8_PORTR|nr:hypothetical protein [Portunus trituberculatus]